MTNNNKSVLFLSFVLLIVVAVSVALSIVTAKSFPPTPDTEEIDLGDKSEDAIHTAMREKLKGTPFEDEAMMERTATGKFDDTPEDAEYAAGGRYRNQQKEGSAHQQHRRGNNANDIKSKEPSACELAPNSHECNLEKKAMEAAERQQDENTNKTTTDNKNYGEIAEQFETSLNEWACSATGLPLFNVSGDKDIIHYVARMISHAFLEQGQHYGSNLVIEYHSVKDNQRRAGTLEPLTCDGIRTGDSTYFNNVLTALLLHRDMMFRWLEKNEVESSAILSAYVPEMRSIIKKWILGRLLFGFGKCLDEVKGEKSPEQHPAVKNCPSRNTEMIMTILPILKDENAPLDQCQAGGQLLGVVGVEKESAVAREVSRMLDSCFEQGKLADDPVEFGETLRKAGREREARELFEIAVQRNKLCNIWQRPEEHHRKDITAAPVWTEESYPPVKAGAKAIKEMFASYEAKPDFNWTKMSAINPTMRSGFFQRSWIFGNHNWNENWKELLTPADTAKMNKFIEQIQKDNDAYEWGCNGSIVLELWRFSGTAPQSEKSCGATNLVLNYISPIRGDRRLVLEIGEDTAQLDPATPDDSLVFDDSYEHRFFFEGVKPASTDSQGVSSFVVLEGSDDQLSLEKKNEIILFKIQLCHPEMHEKALDAPGKYCADGEYE